MSGLHAKNKLHKFHACSSHEVKTVHLATTVTSWTFLVYSQSWCPVGINFRVSLCCIASARRGKWITQPSSLTRPSKIASNWRISQVWSRSLFLLLAADGKIVWPLMFRTAAHNSNMSSWRITQTSSLDEGEMCCFCVTPSDISMTFDLQCRLPKAGCSADDPTRHQQLLRDCHVVLTEADLLRSLRHGEHRSLYERTRQARLVNIKEALMFCKRKFGWGHTSYSESFTAVSLFLIAVSKTLISGRETGSEKVASLWMDLVVSMQRKWVSVLFVIRNAYNCCTVVWQMRRLLWDHEWQEWDEKSSVSEVSSFWGSEIAVFLSTGQVIGFQVNRLDTENQHQQSFICSSFHLNLYIITCYNKSVPLTRLCWSFLFHVHNPPNWTAKNKMFVRHNGMFICFKSRVKLGVRRVRHYRFYLLPLTSGSQKSEYCTTNPEACSAQEIFRLTSTRCTDFRS